MRFQGYRKLAVVLSAFAVLLDGLWLAKDVGTFSAFAAAVVAAGGWYFKSNVEAKTKGTP